MDRDGTDKILIDDLLSRNLKWAEHWDRPGDYAMIARGLRVDEHQADSWAKDLTPPGDPNGYKASVEGMAHYARRAGHARGLATALLLGDIKI